MGGAASRGFDKLATCRNALEVVVSACFPTQKHQAHGRSYLPPSLPIFSEIPRFLRFFLKSRFGALVYESVLLGMGSMI